MNNGQQNPPEQPTINIAEASLVPLPDGSAIAMFSVMGAFNVQIAFPSAVVQQFMKQLLAMKQEQANVLLLAGHIQRTKNS